MELPMNFWQAPTIAELVVERKQLKKILLEHGGRIIANGVLYDIKNTSLGAGVYRIYLRPTCK